MTCMKSAVFLRNEMQKIPCRPVTAEAPFPGFINCVPETTVACETECGLSRPRAEGSGEVDGLGDLLNAVQSLLTWLLKGAFEEVGVFPSAMLMRARDKGFRMQFVTRRCL